MNIKIAILQVLDCSKPYLMPTNALRTEIETRHRGRIGDSDYADAIKQLQDKGFVDFQVDGLTGDTKYRITSAGEAQLKP